MITRRFIACWHRFVILISHMSCIRQTIRFPYVFKILNRFYNSNTFLQTVIQHLDVNINLDSRSWNQADRSSNTWLKTFLLASDPKRISTDTWPHKVNTTSNHLFGNSECIFAINEGDQAQLHEGCTFGKETSSQIKRGDQTRDPSLSRDIREEPLWWCYEGPSTLQVPAN